MKLSLESMNEVVAVVVVVVADVDFIAFWKTAVVVNLLKDGPAGLGVARVG